MIGVEQSELLAFYAFCMTAAVTPGPNNVIIMSAGMRAGFARGLPCVAGGVIGMGILVSTAVWGLGSVLIATPGAFNALRILGVTALLWMSWKIATTPPLDEARQTEVVGFWRMVVFQWVNPKSWVVSASAAASYGAGESGPLAWRAFTMGALFMAAAAPSGVFWLLFGASLQRWLARPKVSRVIFVAMGASLAATVLMVI
jgi:threonine/homoserine/homoserine lactone efflux protein